MANITLWFPAGYTAWSLADGESFPATIVSSTPQEVSTTIVQSMATQLIATRTEGFVLYLTQSVSNELAAVSAAVTFDIASLTKAFNGEEPPPESLGPVFVNGLTVSTGESPLVTVSAPAVVTVPISYLQKATITLGDLSSSLNAEFTRLVKQAAPSSSTSSPDAVAGAPEAQATSTFSASSAKSSSTESFSANSSTEVSFASPSSTIVSSTPVVSGTGDPASNSTGNGDVSQDTFNGAVAGGVVGGLFVGATLCFLIVMCCFKNRRSASRTSRKSELDELAKTPSPTQEKDPRTLERRMSVIGWQKHLPQEKSSRKIHDDFQNLFEHIQMHVDGYYGNVADRSPTEATAALEAVSEDGIHAHAVHARSVLPFLKAILTRWVVHRLSLRSSAEESLLPPEYTRTPDMSRWHMERDEQGQATTVVARRG